MPSTFKWIKNWLHMNSSLNLICKKQNHSFCSGIRVYVQASLCH